MLIFFPAMRHQTSGIAHIPCPTGGWAGMIIDRINMLQRKVRNKGSVSNGLDLMK